MPKTTAKRLEELEAALNPKGQVIIVAMQDLDNPNLYHVTSEGQSRDYTLAELRALYADDCLLIRVTYGEDSAY